MSFPFDTNDMAFPGLESVLETVQNQFWWGRSEQQTFIPATISGAARDAGNTVPDVLRGGLLLGRVTATGFLKEWNPIATDGSEVIFGVLAAPLKMTDAGSDTDRFTYVFVAGNVYSDRLIIKGNADEGIVGDAQEFNVLGQLRDRGILLDKHIQYGNARSYRPRYFTDSENTAHAISVLAADHGRTFLASYINTSGAVTAITADSTITLPAAKVGLTYHVWANSPSYKLTVALASGSIKLPDADGTAAAADINFGESATFVGTAAGVYQMICQTESTTD